MLDLLLQEFIPFTKISFSQIFLCRILIYKLEITFGPIDLLL